MQRSADAASAVCMRSSRCQPPPDAVSAGGSRSPPVQPPSGAASAECSLRRCSLRLLQPPPVQPPPTAEQLRRCSGVSPPVQPPPPMQPPPSAVSAECSLRRVQSPPSAVSADAASAECSLRRVQSPPSAVSADTFAVRAAAMAVALSSPSSCRRIASTSLPRPSRTTASSRDLSSAPRSSANCEGASMSAIRLRACSPTARGMYLCFFSSSTSRRCFPGERSTVSAQWTTQADSVIPASVAPDRTSAHSSSVAEIVCSVPRLRTRGFFVTPALLRRAAECSSLRESPGSPSCLPAPRQQCSSIGRESGSPHRDDAARPRKAPGDGRAVPEEHSRSPPDGSTE